MKMANAITKVFKIILKKKKRERERECGVKKHERLFCIADKYATVKKYKFSLDVGTNVAQGRLFSTFYSQTTRK